MGVLESTLSQLLAIKSCHVHAHLEDIQRRTCLKDCPMDYKFFRGSGRPSTATNDVVLLESPDGFLELPFKMQGIMRWCLEQGYDNVFFADTDTYIRPERLRSSLAPYTYDYVGYFVYDPEPRAYAVGGSGYWLSNRAMRAVVEASFILDTPNHHKMEPSTRGEDLQVGWAVQAIGIRCQKDDRYRLTPDGPLRGNDYVTLHDIRVADKRERVLQAHEAWLNSGGQA